MPLRLLEERLSKLEVPEWGSLPLDVYMLEQWETPHPQSPTETANQRCRRLARQFLSLGILGRQPYYERTDSASPQFNPIYPTEKQIQEILRPFRPEAFRQLARWGETKSGLWVRTCYDKDQDESHRSLWREFVVDGQAIGPDGIVFEDPTLFATNLVGVLEIFPERVTNSSNPEAVQRREEVLMQIEAEGQKYEPNSADALVRARENFLNLGPDKYFQRTTQWTYQLYHAECIVSHAVIEDRKALEVGHVLHVFLDDRGNVVNQDRMNAFDLDNFDTLWIDGAWKERLESGEVGVEYLPGGVHGPPYRWHPYWLNVIGENEQK